VLFVPGTERGVKRAWLAEVGQEEGDRVADGVESGGVQVDFQFKES
jgi:hypothetical protein